MPGEDGRGVRVEQQGRIGLFGTLHIHPWSAGRHTGDGQADRVGTLREETENVARGDMAFERVALHFRRMAGCQLFRDPETFPDRRQVRMVMHCYRESLGHDMLDPLGATAAGRRLVDRDMRNSRSRRGRGLGLRRVPVRRTGDKPDGGNTSDDQPAHHDVGPQQHPPPDWGWVSASSLSVAGALAVTVADSGSLCVSRASDFGAQQLFLVSVIKVSFHWRRHCVGRQGKRDLLRGGIWA